MIYYSLMNEHGQYLLSANEWKYRFTEHIEDAWLTKSKQLAIDRAKYADAAVIEIVYEPTKITVLT